MHICVKRDLFCTFVQKEIRRSPWPMQSTQATSLVKLTKYQLKILYSISISDSVNICAKNSDNNLLSFVQKIPMICFAHLCKKRLGGALDRCNQLQWPPLAKLTKYKLEILNSISISNSVIKVKNIFLHGRFWAQVNIGQINIKVVNVSFWTISIWGLDFLLWASVPRS